MMNLEPTRRLSAIRQCLIASQSLAAGMADTVHVKSLKRNNSVMWEHLMELEKVLPSMADSSNPDFIVYPAIKVDSSVAATSEAQEIFYRYWPKVSHCPAQIYVSADPSTIPDEPWLVCEIETTKKVKERRLRLSIYMAVAFLGERTKGANRLQGPLKEFGIDLTEGTLRTTGRGKQGFGGVTREHETFVPSPEEESACQALAMCLAHSIDPDSRHFPPGVPRPVRINPSSGAAYQPQPQLRRAA